MSMFDYRPPIAPPKPRVVHVADWERRVLEQAGRDDLVAKLWAVRARLFAIVDAEKHGETAFTGRRTPRERTTPQVAQVWARQMAEVEDFIAAKRDGHIR